jgi:hypothetical protein
MISPQLPVHQNVTALIKEGLCTFEKVELVSRESVDLAIDEEQKNINMISGQYLVKNSSSS